MIIEDIGRILTQLSVAKESYPDLIKTQIIELKDQLNYLDKSLAELYNMRKGSELFRRKFEV